MKLIGKTVPKIESLLEKRRAYTTRVVMREYEISMMVGSFVIGLFVPYGLPYVMIFSGIMVVCMVIMNMMLQRYTSQMTIRILYSTLLYLRIWSCFIYYGYSGGTLYLLFNHFITAILFFPDNPRFMELESLVMAATYFFFEIFFRNFSGLSHFSASQHLLIVSGVRIWVFIILLTETVIYVFLYSVREFAWYEKLFQVLMVSNRKQASFLGMLCHVSKTALNSIIPPIEKQLMEIDAEEKECPGSIETSCLVPKTKRTDVVVERKMRRIFYYSSYVHSSIQLLVDYHENKQHETYVITKEMSDCETNGERNNQVMIHQQQLSCEDLNLGEFMNQIRAHHRLIFKDKQVSFHYIEQISEQEEQEEESEQPNELEKKPLSSFVVSIDKSRIQRVFTYLIFYVLEDLRSIGSVLVQTKFIESSLISIEESKKKSLYFVFVIKFRREKSKIKIEGEDENVFDISITKKNVEMMNGTMDISSSDLTTNQALLTIETKIPFPIIRQESQEEESEGEQEEEEEEKPKFRILIVEDEMVNRMVLHKCCSTGLSEDSEIVCAVDGVDGLKMFREMSKSGRHIDICFIDYNMPRMNGVELAHEIRQSFADDVIEQQQEKPKLVLVTAMLIGKYFEGRDLFDEAYSKPIREKTIHDVFQRLEREKRRADTHEEEAGEAEQSPSQQNREAYIALGQVDVEGPIGMDSHLTRLRMVGESRSIISEQSILDMEFMTLKNQSSYLYYIGHFLPIILHLIFVLPTSLTISSWFYPLYIFIFTTMKYLHRFVVPKTIINDKEDDDKGRIDRKTDILLYHLSTIFICSYLLGGSHFRFRCQMFTFAPILIIVNISLQKVYYFHTLFQVMFISFVYVVLEVSKFEGILSTIYMDDVYGDPISGTNETFNLFCDRFNSILEIMQVIHFVELVGRKIVPQFKKRKKEYIMLITKLKEVKEEQGLVISKISNSLSFPLQQMNHELHELEEKHNFGGRRQSQHCSLFMKRCDHNSYSTSSSPHFYGSETSRYHKKKKKKKKKKNEEERLCSFPYTKRSVQELNLLNMNFKILFNISQSSSSCSKDGKSSFERNSQNECPRKKLKNSSGDDDNENIKRCFILKIIRKIVEKEKKILIKTKQRLFLYITTSIDNKNIIQQQQREERSFVIYNIGRKVELTQQKEGNNDDKKTKLSRFEMSYLFSIIITNLIHNSTKNTNLGSIEVILNYSTKKKCCEIIVRDTGVGMKPEELLEVQKRIEECMSEEDEDINEILTSESIMDSVVLCGGGDEEKRGRRSRRSSSVVSFSSSSEVLKAIGSPSLGIGLVVCNRIITEIMDGKMELVSEGINKGMKVCVLVPCDLVM